MRITQNKNRILEALGDLDETLCCELGQPPRNAACIALILGNVDPRQVARTLRLLERQGLVIGEVRPVDVWCNLKQGSNHYAKQLKCYWRTSTAEADRAWVEKREAARPVPSVEAVLGMFH